MGDEADFEIEFNRHGVTPGFDRYQMHRPCFRAWKLERAEVEGPST
jgi:hypothetical protein